MPAVPATIVFAGPVLTMDSVDYRDRRRCGDRQSDPAQSGPPRAESIGRYAVVKHGTGKLLIPGFQDAHVPSRRRRCQAHDVRPARIRRCRRHLGRGRRLRRWHTPKKRLDHGRRLVSRRLRRRHPDARMLDSVVADRPAYLPNRDHHGAWVNSRAADRRDHRPTRRIHRADASNATPTVRPPGCFEAAMDLVAAHVPRPRRTGCTEHCSTRRTISTPWASRPGRTRFWRQAAAVPGAERAAPACRARRNPDGAGRGGFNGGSATGAPNRSRGDGRASNRVAARATPCQHGQDHSRRYRREPDRRHAGALPEQVRLRHAGMRSKPSTGSVARLCVELDALGFGAFPCARRPRAVRAFPRRDRSRPACQRRFHATHGPSGTSAGGRSARHPRFRL